jgi:ribonuclease H-related protein
LGYTATVELLTTEIFKPGQLVIYTDGSFNSKTKVYGAGVVSVRDGVEITRYKLSGDIERYSAEYQIAGEILAAMKAMSIAVEEKESLVIAHDYLGVANWINNVKLGNTGDKWKSKSTTSRDYVSFYQNIVKEYPSFDVEFLHIYSHQGNHYNEVADQLAKRACGIIN